MHAELERRLSFCGNLPTLPVVALRVIALANDPEVHLNDVAKVIAMDPALVTKLFRAANSPLYGRRRQATNLRQALSLLGLRGSLILALSFSLIATARDVKTFALDIEQFWRRSLLTATAGRILGERLALKNLEELFLAGLLHGIGIMALAIMMPDRYGKLLTDATDQQAGMPGALDYERLAKLERERLEVDHARVGAWLLHRWGLPDYLCHAAAGSLNPGDSAAPEHHRTLVECVALASRIADIWIRPGYWLRSPQVADLARQWFGMGADDYVKILEAVGAQFPEVAEMFQIQIQDAIEVDGILEQAREALALRNAQLWSDVGESRLQSEDLASSPLPSAVSSSTTLDVAKSPARDRPPSFDALTGLFDRPYLDELLSWELANARGQNWPLSVALLDLDDFRRINENHGRVGGDRILIELGRLLGGRIRRHDVVARFGDDAFALLLPACGVEGARGLVERLLALIGDWEPMLEDGSRVRISVSAGLATYPDTGLADCDSCEQLLHAVEHALKIAKSGGGGRLVIYEE
mgnify:CR=1 FL=1